MTRVAVSMLNFNSAQSTIACVQSLLIAEGAASGNCDLEIYLSDNASGEEDQHQLQVSLGETAKVHFHINEENLGFATGHNRNLARMFFESAPDYIWILNNDCLVADTALVELVKCAKQSPAVGLWGATLLEEDGETIECAGGCFYNTWISSYRQYGHGKPVSALEQLKPVKYDYIAGASLFFPVSTLQTGLEPLCESETDERPVHKQWLNERFFLYFEELDLARRLKQGSRMAWCKTAVIKHMGGASTGTIDNQRTAVAEYHSTVSALKFTQLYYPHRLWFMAPARFISKCLLLIVQGEFRLVGIVAKAYRDFWRDGF